MKINVKALGAIQQQFNGTQKTLGTSFCFLKSSWFVTAKHVLEKSPGVVRDNLLLSLHQEDLEIDKLYLHRYRDLALIELGAAACDDPFYPSNFDLEGEKRLLKFGYSPAATADSDMHVLDGRYIDDFEIQERERDDGKEKIFVFKDEHAEGGNSGGPVLSMSGGIVAVIIDGYTNNSVIHATDSKVLMELISLDSMFLDEIKYKQS